MEYGSEEEMADEMPDEMEQRTINVHNDDHLDVCFIFLFYSEIFPIVFRVTTVRFMRTGGDVISH